MNTEELQLVGACKFDLTHLKLSLNRRLFSLVSSRLKLIHSPAVNEFQVSVDKFIFNPINS